MDDKQLTHWCFANFKRFMAHAPSIKIIVKKLRRLESSTEEHMCTYFSDRVKKYGIRIKSNKASLHTCCISAKKFSSEMGLQCYKVGGGKILGDTAV